jgi:hypothetical protein
MKVGRIVFGHGPSPRAVSLVPEYKLRGARAAHEMAEEALRRSEEELRQATEEMLRARRRVMALDPDAPEHEFDGNAWAGYWKAVA